MGIIRNLFLITFLASNINVYSVNDQNNIDSLIHLLPSYNDSKEKVDLLVRIASDLMTINFDKSIYYSSEALALAKKIKYDLGYSHALGRYGLIYLLKSNYVSSLEIYLQKLRFEDSLEFRTEMANTCNLIGNIFFFTKEYEKALNYYNRSLLIYKEYNLEKGIGKIYTCIGNIYEANNETQKAEYFYNAGLNIHLKYLCKKDIVISYNNLGILFFEHYKDTSASLYFKKALKYFPEISDKSIHALVYGNYGDYFLWRHNLDSALLYLNKGLKIARYYSLPIYIKDISGSLSNIYSEKKDFEKAFSFQKEYMSLVDSLFSINISSKLAFLDYQYSQKRIENLRTIAYLKQQREIRTKLSILIIVIILICSSTGLFIMYYRNKIKQEKLSKEKLNIETVRLKEQLNFKNREIVIFTINLFERNELIRQVIKKLNNIYPMIILKNKPLIEDVINNLKGKYHDNVLNEFEHRFKEVHNNFYKNISDDFPTLTANDMRLCAFLKMNMNTKDIAFLSHQSVNSIEVARTRLRKKLNIQHTDIDLIMFLSRY